MKNSSQPWLIEWEPLEEIGAGGQGVVTRLRNREDQTSYAVLKTITPRWRGHEQAISRLAQEIETLEKLSGNGARVPKVIDSFLTHSESEPFLVMELIEGVRFDEWLKANCPCSIEEAKKIVEAISETINLCHSNNIGHRDIKPANIILKGGSATLPYILDFGISFDSRHTYALTREGEMFWNEFIIIPECQDLSGQHRDLRSDITALVGIFFTCITGIPPIILKDSEDRAPHQRHSTLLARQISHQPLVERLHWFFNKGFGFRPSDRYQNLEEFSRALHSLTEDGEEDDLDIMTEFERFDEMLKSTNRGIQIASLLKNYTPILTKIESPLGKEMNPMTTRGWHFRKEILRGDPPPPNFESGEEADLLTANFTVYFLTQNDFPTAIGVIISAYGIGMNTHIYAGSYTIPKIEIHTFPSTIYWSKSAILIGGTENPHTEQAIRSSITKRFAYEMRKFSKIAN